ncbi:MAG: glycosyltransferase family 9 protein [bacterium]
MTESKLGKIGKRAELALRRAFISSLQYRSRLSRKRSSSKVLSLRPNPTILFLRQDRLGDAIVSTPVLIAIKEKIPDARFIILLGSNNKGIVDLLPVECEICVYQKKPLADIAMLRRLRNRKIDVLIDLMDNPSSTSSILVAAIAAKHSIGIEKENSTSYDITVPLLNRGKYHIARRMLELVRPFGIDPETISLKPQLVDIRKPIVKGKVGLVISAGVRDRCFTPKQGAEIAVQLIRLGMAAEVRIYFQQRDLDSANEIAVLTNDTRISVQTPTDSFAGYAAELTSCEFVISPDTSALHLCSAYNIPVVAVYQPSPPDLHYWTPIGVRYEMIIAQPSLSHLNVEEVIVAFEKLRQTIRTKSTMTKQEASEI